MLYIIYEDLYMHLWYKNMHEKEKHIFRPGIIPGNNGQMNGWLVFQQIGRLDCLLTNTYVITTCSTVHNIGNIQSFQCEHLFRKYSNFFHLFILLLLKRNFMLLKNSMFFILSKLSQKQKLTFSRKTKQFIGKLNFRLIHFSSFRKDDMSDHLLFEN